MPLMARARVVPKGSAHACTHRADTHRCTPVTLHVQTLGVQKRRVYDITSKSLFVFGARSAIRPSILLLHVIYLPFAFGRLDVLEGIGVIEKTKKNIIQWADHGNDVDKSQTEAIEAEVCHACGSIRNAPFHLQSPPRYVHCSQPRLLMLWHPPKLCL